MYPPFRRQVRHTNLGWDHCQQTAITCAAQELPSHIPEAEEGDDIACVVLAGGPSSAPSDTPPSDPDGAPPLQPWMYWAKPLESSGEDGLGELGGSDERDVGDKSESATGAVRDAVAESDEHAPIANIGVPVLPPTDIPACHTSGVTKHPTGTEDEGGSLLEGTQMSEFGCKRKLHNMHNVSACLCGKSAGPSAAQMAGDEVVCCRVASCETKWYHIICVGLSFSPKSWTCEVCQSDTGILKRRRM
ncbi:hypothetical protein EDB84DRAFT_1574733 [Lactarius hengduanensis]|nr:hypothetical protein EDB84DRAFT_1574733 [Lactarius hengduanensis]